MTKVYPWALVAVCGLSACLDVDDLPKSRPDASVDAGSGDASVDAETGDAPDREQSTERDARAPAPPQPPDDADVEPDARVPCDGDGECSASELCELSGVCGPRCTEDVCTVAFTSGAFCGLEARGDTVYWALCSTRDPAGNERHDGELWRKKSGETPTLLASGLSTSNGPPTVNYTFALDDTHAYYARGEQMLRVALSGASLEDALYDAPPTRGCRVWTLGAEAIVFAADDALWSGGLTSDRPPQRLRDGVFCVDDWVPLYVDGSEIYYAETVSTRPSRFTPLRHVSASAANTVVETAVTLFEPDGVVRFDAPYIYRLSTGGTSYVQVISRVDLRDGSRVDVARSPNRDSGMQSALIGDAWAYWADTMSKDGDSYLTLRRASLADAEITQVLADVEFGVPRLAALFDRIYLTLDVHGGGQALKELVLPPAP